MISIECFSYKTKEPLVRIDRGDEVNREAMPEDRTQCRRPLRIARQENAMGH